MGFESSAEIVVEQHLMFGLVANGMEWWDQWDQLLTAAREGQLLTTYHDLMPQLATRWEW